MRHLKTLLPLVFVMILLVAVADAKPRGRLFFRRPLITPAPAAAQAAAANPDERHQPNDPEPYWSMVPERYPQWYGGFHGRMLQDYGYAPGDLGLRGRAW